MENTYTFRDLKKMIAHKEDIPVDQQRLIWGGVQREDGEMGQYGESNEADVWTRSNHGRDQHLQGEDWRKSFGVDHHR